MINSSNFEQLIVTKKATALLFFTAAWCRPCLLQKPVIESLKQKYAQQVLIDVIDVDADASLADKFSARTLPTCVLFCEGEVVEALAGYQAEDFISSYLDHIIAMQSAKETNEQK